MYRPYSRAGSLAKALAAASVAASWPGMLALPVAFAVPAALFIPLTAFAIAFGHGLILGLPLYLLLDRYGWANGWLAGLAGACIGTVPVLIATAIRYFEIPSGFRPQPDVMGWVHEAGGALCVFGFLGVCGGLAFFAVASGSGAVEE